MFSTAKKVLRMNKVKRLQFEFGYLNSFFEQNIRTKQSLLLYYRPATNKQTKSGSIRKTSGKKGSCYQEDQQRKHFVIQH